MTTRTRVAMTYEELSPGVPFWGANTVTTDLLPDQTEVAIENLVAGRTYYIKTWNEDSFGNKSPELLSVVNTPTPTRMMPLVFSANGYFDSGSGMYAYVKVPPSVQSISEVKVTVAFRAFVAPAKDAASSGMLTSDSGGGSTTVAGGGSTTTSGGGSTSGSSSASSTAGDISHVHPSMLWQSNTPAGGTAIRKYDPVSSGGTFVNLDTSAANDMFTGLETAPGHTHGIPHTHTTPSHAHATPDHAHATPDHGHTVPGHTHALDYGTFEEAYPVSHSVFMNVYKLINGTWTIMHTFTGMTDDLVNLNLTGIIDGPGDWRMAIASDVGQPNGGRLSADIYGSILAILGDGGGDGSGTGGGTGANGADGAAGARGADARPGIDGIDGEDGLQGPPGPTGPAGFAGVAGATGPMGPPGFAVDGEDGADGAPGAAGATGAAGANGADGRPGIDGEAGDDGQMGPAGLPGTQGATGPAGAVGAVIHGVDGDDGADGIMGPIGPAGAAGSQGAAGAVGPVIHGRDGDDGDDSISPPFSPSALWPYSLVGHGAADHADINRSFWLDPQAAGLDGATLIAVGASPNLSSAINYADAATSGAYWEFLVPADYASGALSIQPQWTPGATDAVAHTVRWSYTAKTISGGIDVTAAGTTVAFTGASAARTLNIVVSEAAQGTITPGALARVMIELQRIGADAADTYVGAVRLIGVIVTYTANQ